MYGEKGYLELMTNILSLGQEKTDRTGVGTRGFFGRQLHFDLRQGFPLLTTKRVFFRAVVHELLWFLSGSTSVKPLQEAGISIWDEWATKEQCAKFGREEGDLGPVYGHQFRNFGATKNLDRGDYGDHDHEPHPFYMKDGVDQIARVIKDIKANPYSRRHIVTAWNPKEADEVTLPPCHTLFQFHVMPGDTGELELSCHLYQRSADLFLGVPFNIASYALLTHMMAWTCQMQVGDLIISYGDVHIYKNHFDQCREQVMRQPRPLPKLVIASGNKDIDDFKADDFVLNGYDPHPAIKAPVAV